MNSAEYLPSDEQGRVGVPVNDGLFGAAFAQSANAMVVRDPNAITSFANDSFAKLVMAFGAELAVRPATEIVPAWIWWVAPVFREACASGKSDRVAVLMGETLASASVRS